MAMKLSGASDSTIMRVGRWSSHIPNVHSLADWRTDSRTVEADGDASEIPKRGMISPGGRFASWNHNRMVDWMSKESSL